MKYQAILFDLDGTLLPMDYDEFTKGYFRLLAGMASGYGYQKEALVPALWKGVAAMVQNDGSCLNYHVFWKVFSEILGPEICEYIPAFDKFYENEFKEAVAFTGPNPLAKEAVALAKAKADCVVLATNPLFPPAGVKTRLGWVGLSLEDFSHVTHYENSCYCKPNPEYYREILKKLGLAPSECLMIGNDAQEDVEAAKAAGLDTFLVTDCLISRGEMPDCPQGSFVKLIEFLKSL